MYFCAAVNFDHSPRKYIGAWAGCFDSEGIPYGFGGCVMKETVSADQTADRGSAVKHGVEDGTGHALRLLVDHGSGIAGAVGKVELIGCADTEFWLYHEVYLCPLIPVNIGDKRDIAGSFRRCQSLNVL